MAAVRPRELNLPSDGLFCGYDLFDFPIVFFGVPAFITELEEMFDQRR